MNSFIKKIIFKLFDYFFIATKVESFKSSDVTIVSQFFPPDFAATGQLLDDLSKRLSSRGLKTNIVTSLPYYAFNDKSGKYLNLKKRSIIKIKSTFQKSRKIHIRLINGLYFSILSFFILLTRNKRGKITIYSTEPPFLPLVGFIHSIISKSPFILIIYDLYPDVITNLKILKKGNIIIYCWKKINNIIFKKANEIIVLSESMEKKLINDYPKTKSKISVIPSWADTEKIKPINKFDNWFIKKYNLQKKFVVLYSGNQGRAHDLLTIIKSCLCLRKNKKIKFLFIGAGAKNEEIKRLTNSWGLDNCLFLPYQEFENLGFTLTSGDLALVSLEKEMESLIAPSKLYGHLAAGTPIAVISPKKCYLRNLVEKEKFGRWFKNGDYEGLTEWIQYLSENPKVKDKIGKISRLFIEKNASSKVILETYLNLINKYV